MEAASEPRAWKRQPILHALRSGRWDVARVVLYALRISQALIDLDDRAALVNQEGDGEAKVPAPVKKIAVEDVVDGGCILGGEQDRKPQPVLARETGRSLLQSKCDALAAIFRNVATGRSASEWSPAPGPRTRPDRRTLPWCVEKGTPSLPVETSLAAAFRCPP